MNSIVRRRERGLSGALSVPGDKSITHRALFFGALSDRRTTICNPSPAHDCRTTLLLLRQLGYHIAEHASCWELDPSLQFFRLPKQILDCGNSGTTARLAAGFLLGEPGEYILVGDESLSRRPMERVAAPLRRMGGKITTTNGFLPMFIHEEEEDSPEIEEETEEYFLQESLPLLRIEGEDSDGIDVASAQVHGALVLAAARSAKGVLLRRTKPMRDHTLRMASLFGVHIESRGEEDFVHPLHHRKESPDRTPVDIDVPGDPSSAAFLVVAALLVPGSDLTIDRVCLNPTRISFLETVLKMGGEIEWNVHEGKGDHHEPVGTVRVRYSPGLRGIAVGEENDPAVSVALMMDELPLLALVASQAVGETSVHGAAELRVKESDRITATAALLGSIGILVEEREDGFRVVGPQQVKGGRTVDHQGDHRLAMLAGIAGLVAEEPVIVPDPDIASVSWPGFWELEIFD